MTDKKTTSRSNKDDKKKTTLIAYLLLLSIVFVATFYMIAPYMLAVMTGIICALVLRPLFRWLQQKKIGRIKFGPKISAGIITVLLTLVLLGPVTGFIVAAVDEGINLSKYITGEQFPTFKTIADKVTSWGPAKSVLGEAEAIEKQIRSGIQTGAKTATAGVLALIGSLPELGLQLFLVLITFYFALLDGKRCLTWMRDRVPLDHDVRDRLTVSFRDTAISSIWATMAAAAVQAGIMLFAFLVLGVPAAFLAAGATFIFSWIPILGSFPVWITGAIYLYTKDTVATAIIMLIFGVICSVADNLVRPLVLKGRDDMHPLVSLIAIFGGIYLFGILGVFFGSIVIAIFLSLLNIWPAISARFGLMDDSV